MESQQDTTFNYKIILSALVAVIIAIVIAFYYSYAQSQRQMELLEDEKKLLVKDLTLMRAEVDRISGLNEVGDIELQTSRFRIQQLLDSVGQLNFNIMKLKEDRKSLRVLESKYDSLKLKNNFLRYNNSLLTDRYEKARRQIAEMRDRSQTLQQAEVLERKNEAFTKKLKVKSFLKLEGAEGSGFRLRAGRPLKTNKASVVEKLRGCVTVMENSEERQNDVKVVYFQFLDPDMKVIEDNSKAITVGGNTYSKRVEVVYFGKELKFCDAITISAGSLDPGIYTLNIFERERLLSSTEFQLK